MTKLNIVAIQKLLQFALLHFALKKVITFCVGKLLHFALIILLHFALILLHFVLVLRFAAIAITFCVSITFCGDYYISRRNRIEHGFSVLNLQLKKYFHSAEVLQRAQFAQECNVIECMCFSQCLRANYIVSPDDLHFFFVNNADLLMKNSC